MNKVILITIFSLNLTFLYGQDGSDMNYVEIKELDKSFIGKFVHLDFYNDSFWGHKLDTIEIYLNVKPIKFIEHRVDNGHMSFFSGQYLESIKHVDGFKIRIVKSKILEITHDSIKVLNYFEFYDNQDKLQAGKSQQNEYWFKKSILTKVLFQVE